MYITTNYENVMFPIKHSDRPNKNKNIIAENRIVMHGKVNFIITTIY